MTNLTVSNKIKNNLINFRDFKDIKHFAKSENMMIRDVLLKDNSNVLLLANQNEIDCLIMQNGKIVASKGCFGEKTDEPCNIAMKIYDHIIKKNLTTTHIDLKKEWMSFLDEYIYRFM